MLRINTDGSIPSDNPFFGTASGKNRAIFALGLRNPFTFAFNPSLALMFINDVGQNTWEEINDGAAGANYGWPDTEGATSDSRFVGPRYTYNHSTGACAITGGAFYAPAAVQFPQEYLNDYFFADYCGGWIRKLDPASGNTVTTFATGIASPVDLKVGDDGSLYYLARGSGSTTGVVYRVSYAATVPSITQQPASQTVAPGASVTFSVRASGPGTLRYQWQRNGTNISGATAANYVIASAAASDNGARFRAIVSNDAGSVMSTEATLTVSTNVAPTGTITQPAAGTLYSGGSIINYAGTGTDPEDGTLPASAFTWRVDFHHDTHTHPFIAPTSGSRTGSFTIPTTGETSANVWYRIYLTVRDAQGLTHTSTRDVLPRKVRLTLATSPAGLQLRLDGQPMATPLAFDSVVGIMRNIEAPATQTSGTTTYQFVSWSDGGAAAHNVSTPSANTTYTATYRVVTSTAAIHVNFQPAGVPVPSGYLADTGLVFANRGNGQSYGWTIDNSAQTRDRNSSLSTDQRYDTLTHLQKPGNPDAVWEIAVPNGTYSVHVASGDAGYIDSVFRVMVEGVLTVNGTPTATAHWIGGTQTVTVSDGRLTIRSGAGATNNKICFVDITRQ